MKHSKVKYIQLLLFCLVVCLTGLANGAGVAHVAVKNLSKVSGEKVYLRDIAEITGPIEVKDIIGGVEIASSPKPGKGKKIPGSSVESKIRSKVSWLGSGLKIQSPEFIMVERISQQIPDSGLKDLFNRYVSEKHKGKDYRITGFKIKGNKSFPSGKLTLHAEERNKRSGAGRVSLDVDVNVDKTSVGKIYLSAQVDVFENVVCAKREIRKGVTIDREDLCLIRKNISKTPPGTSLAFDNIVGKVSKSRLRKGSAVRASQLERAPVVEKDGMVKLVARSGRLQVVTLGIAKADGRIGDQVLVENVSSGKKVMGRVVEPDTIEVLF